MRYWKCIKSGEKNKFTVDKIYSTWEDGSGLIADNKESGWINPARMSKVAEFIEVKEGENKVEDLRELIKPCYIVVHIDNTLSRVEINCNNEKIISGDTHWCNLHSLSKELLGYCGDSNATIKEIYGYSEYNNIAYKLSIEGRPLIWKREEEPIKSPTQLEIESIELEQRKLADRLAKLKENS